MRYAQILAENGPLAVQAVKKAVLAGSGLSIEAAFGCCRSISRSSRRSQR